MHINTVFDLGNFDLFFSKSALFLQPRTIFVCDTVTSIKAIKSPFLTQKTRFVLVTIFSFGLV